MLFWIYIPQTISIFYTPIKNIIKNKLHLIFLKYDQKEQFKISYVDTYKR